MAMAVRNEGAKVNSNINVTPMVDVMLVLLIVFMVITPMLQHGVSVDMAKVNSPIPMPDADKEDALLVAIMRDGQIYFGTDHVNYAAVLGASVGLDEYPFVHLVGQAVFYLRGQLVGLDLIAAEKDLSVAHDGHQQGILLVGVRHRHWIIDPGHVHAHALLQHGRDDHENDE